MQQKHRDRRNQKATVAIICTIASFFIGISAPVGLILGIVSLKEIKKSEEKGEVLAWLSIIISALEIIVSVSLVLWLSGTFGGQGINF